MQHSLVELQGFLVKKGHCSTNALMQELFWCVLQQHI